MSDSVQPRRRQPTRLPRPRDFPGKNTGVGCHLLLQCMKAKSESEVAQSCLTLCDPMDCSPPGSSAHGIFQARGLEWGAIAFRFNSRCAWLENCLTLMGACMLYRFSCVRLLVTPWIATYQAPPPTGFSRQEYWSGVPLPSPQWYYTGL